MVSGGHSPILDTTIFKQEENKESKLERSGKAKPMSVFEKM